LLGFGHRVRFAAAQSHSSGNRLLLFRGNGTVVGYDIDGFPTTHI
jgi:hypothetical protein